MKVLAVFTVLIAACASSAIPLIPGDNSHYVEGVSQYIWMPDGEGIPHLVDLYETVEEEPMSLTRRGASNEYWLFTRKNPHVPQIITFGDVQSIKQSNYDSKKALKVIAHGWNNDGKSSVNTVVTEAFLEVADVNVIVVNWGRTANGLYTIAVRGVPSVGEYTGQFVSWLINNAGGDLKRTHLVGFSLGAHVVGNAGRALGGQVARITGLDPAGPLWGGSKNSLDATDGEYVETIHTDGGLLGIFDPIGAVNFYPNGGRHSQPGCLLSTCSHSRSYEYFAASIIYDHFIAYECKDLREARRGNCSGAPHKMGNADLPKTGNGLYGLKTGRNWPF